MPTDQINPYRPLIVAGVLIVLAALLFVARGVLIPIALGILLTFILTPAVSWLQSRGLRRTNAVLIVVFWTLILIVGILTGLTLQLRQLARDLPDQKEQIRQKMHDLMGRGPGVVERLTAMVADLNSDLEGGDEDLAAPLPLRVRAESSSGGMVSLLVGPLAATLGAFSLTVALTVSMLLMREDLRNRLLLLLGEGQLTSTTRALEEASQRISKYLTVQVMLNASFGTLFGLGLWIIGVPYALLWGFLAAVLRFIPFIGTWMAAVFPVLVSLPLQGWTQPITVMVYVVLLGILTNNVVEPLLVSRSTGVTPIALVVAAAFWTWIWGPIGLILATPLTVCLSVLGKYVPSLRFLDILLGSAAPLGPELKLYQRLLARDETEAGDLLEEYLAEHTPEQLLDAVVLPALGRARSDEERGHLTNVERSALVRSVRELLEVALEDAPADEPAGGTLLCVAAHDEVDELALSLLGRVLAPNRVEVIGPDTTVAEVVQRVGDESVKAICVAVVPPAGTARTRYLCKRLRAGHPDTAIIVGLWGQPTNEHLARQLRDDGATHVVGSLAEARQRLAPLLQVAMWKDESEGRKTPEEGRKSEDGGRRKEDHQSV